MSSLRYLRGVSCVSFCTFRVSRPLLERQPPTADPWPAPPEYDWNRSYAESASLLSQSFSSRPMAPTDLINQDEFGIAPSRDAPLVERSVPRVLFLKQVYGNPGNASLAYDLFMLGLGRRFLSAIVPDIPIVRKRLWRLRDRVRIIAVDTDTIRRIMEWPMEPLSVPHGTIYSGVREQMRGAVARFLRKSRPDGATALPHLGAARGTAAAPRISARAATQVPRGPAPFVNRDSPNRLSWEERNPDDPFVNDTVGSNASHTGTSGLGLPASGAIGADVHGMYDKLHPRFAAGSAGAENRRDPLIERPNMPSPPTNWVGDRFDGAATPQAIPFNELPDWEHFGRTPRSDGSRPGFSPDNKSFRYKQSPLRRPIYDTQESAQIKGQKSAQAPTSGKASGKKEKKSPK